MCIRDRCVVPVALWLVMSASDCEAVANGTTRLVGLVLCKYAAGLVGWVCGCVRLVRTVCKSLARVLTPSALDLSLCLLQCMLRCRLCACCSLPSLCVWALLRAPPPIGLKCCVSVCCDQGGAIHVGNSAQVDIRGSVLSNNQAVRGAGGALARHERQ